MSQRIVRLHDTASGLVLVSLLHLLQSGLRVHVTLLHERLDIVNLALLLVYNVGEVLEDLAHGLGRGKRQKLKRESDGGAYGNVATHVALVVLRWLVTRICCCLRCFSSCFTIDALLELWSFTHTARRRSCQAHDNINDAVLYIS